MHGRPHGLVVTHVSPAAQYARLWRVAVEHIHMVVRSEAQAVHMPDGSTWFDLHPLLSAHEVSAASADHDRELIDLGLELGVLARFPVAGQSYLVRIVEMAELAELAGHATP